MKITDTVTEQKILKLLSHQLVKSWSLRFARTSTGYNQFWFLVFQVGGELFALVDDDGLYLKYQDADNALQAVAELGIKITNLGAEI